MPTPTASPAAETPARPPRGKSGAWAGGIAIALLLYVLSIGPVAGLAEKYPQLISNRMFETIYAPVGWCAKGLDEATGTEIATGCLIQYMELCGYHVFVKAPCC